MRGFRRGSFIRFGGARAAFLPLFGTSLALRPIVGAVVYNFITMSTRTREIVAILLLVLLVIGGFMAMMGYLIVGHGWNVTATNIDDHMGNMDGYSVVVYDGTAKPARDQRDSDGLLYDATPYMMLDEQNRSEYPPGREPVLEARKGVSAREAALSYMDKGATAFIVRINDFSRYYRPMIVEKNGLRLGMYSIHEGMSAASAAAKALYVRERGADFAIALVDNAASIGRVSETADIVICAYDAGISDLGRIYGNTLIVDSPLATTVGAILIAPSGVVSAKVVESL